MADSWLTVAPLLVLAVVLVLGFVGCDRIFNLEEVDVPAPPPPTLVTFTASVPTDFTVLDGGVRFAWKRPSATVEEMATVPSFTTEGSVNVYQHQIESSKDESGMGWLARCAMKVGVDTHTADGNSGDQDGGALAGDYFEVLPFTRTFVTFGTKGSPRPQDIPFDVVFQGTYNP
jgi:hypothetical protein